MTVRLRAVSLEMTSSGRAYQEFISRLDGPIGPMGTRWRSSGYRRATGLVEELRQIEGRRNADLLVRLEAAQVGPGVRKC
jgi:hypothetical protein